MICPKCGTENGDSSLKCVKCWRPLKPLESGHYLGSKPKLPEQTSSKKLPPVKIKRMVSILLLIAVLFSVIPLLIENIGKIGDIKEKVKQEAIRLTSEPKEEMIEAVKANQRDKVLALLEQKPSLVNEPLIGRGGGGGKGESFVVTRPLHTAAEKGHLEMVRLLLDRGADIHGKGYCEQTPLHVASRNAQVEVMSHLFERGAKVNAVDCYGGTPLYSAMEYRRRDAKHVLLLLQKGAALNARDKEQQTPLHSAAMSGNGWAASILCAHGADLKARNRSGKTPADVAREGKNEDTAAWLGSAEGCRGLAETYARTGTVGEDRLKLAVWLYECDVRFETSCTNAGYAYKSGKGVTANPVRAVELYRKGCDGGSMTGCNNLGNAYDNGKGVVADPVRGAELHRKACDGGEMMGCTSLGYAYKHGQGVAADPMRAAELYRKACDGGNMMGCSNLGNSYRDGVGVPRDLARANELFKKACDGRDMLGCNNLGYAYREGVGVPRDMARATELYKKACAGGYTDACK